MKTLKQFREDYDCNYVPEDLDEQVMLEAVQKKLGIKKISNVPSMTEMPNLLMFRRITYRRYPDDQVVALYYSKTVDKYLSIPFGPTGNLNLSEASIYDTLEELDLQEGAKWEAVKGGIKGALKGGTVGFVAGTTAHIPGSMIGTAGGAAYGAYKGAKKAYKKAKEQENMQEDWDCEKSFRAKLASIKEENQVNEFVGPILQGVGRLALGTAAGEAIAAGSAQAARKAPQLVGKALEKTYKTLRGSKSTKTIKPRKAEPTSKKPSGSSKLDALASAADAAKETSKSSSSSVDTGDAVKKLSTDISKPKAKVYTPSMTKGPSPVDYARINTLTRKEYESSKKSINENKITDLRSMIDEGIERKDLWINGRNITLNSSMAKRILEVYDSVNAKNKKIVEGMLNEDLESFKKLLNFSIKA